MCLPLLGIRHILYKSHRLVEVFPILSDKTSELTGFFLSILSGHAKKIRRFFLGSYGDTKQFGYNFQEYHCSVLPLECQWRIYVRTAH